MILLKPIPKCSLWSWLFNNDPHGSQRPLSSLYGPGLRLGDVFVDGWQQFYEWEMLEAGRTVVQSSLQQMRADGRISDGRVEVSMHDDGGIHADLYIQPVRPVETVHMTWSRENFTSDDEFEQFQQTMRELVDKLNAEKETE